MQEIPASDDRPQELHVYEMAILVVFDQQAEFAKAVQHGAIDAPAFGAPSPKDATRPHGTMSAIEEIAAERCRQVEVKGYTHEHDDTHTDGELACAAAAYACTADKHHINPEGLWPFEEDAFKPSDVRSNLIRAGALIVAEIERLDRSSSR